MAHAPAPTADDGEYDDDSAVDVPVPSEQAQWRAAAEAQARRSDLACGAHSVPLGARVEAADEDRRLRDANVAAFFKRLQTLAPNASAAADIVVGTSQLIQAASRDENLCRMPISYRAWF